MNPTQAALRGLQQGRIVPVELNMDCLAPGESMSCPPPVAPLETAESRPFWSVMIPCYNPDPRFFSKALRGVLAAGVGEAEMQIEVVDNASTVDVAEMVRSVAGDRVKVYRHPENIGGRRNWNACIDRAKGEWVHILHVDDLVLPEFFDRMREAIESEPTAGAAFCRHAHILEDDRPFYISDLERETPGIIENWLQRIAVMQRVQPPSIVVRRSVYEELGGFWSAARTCIDWEMWVRIAARFPVLFHPGVMACYRRHGKAATAELLQSAKGFSDAGMVIDLFKNAFPEDQRDELARLGKQHYARSAYRSAESFIREKNYAAANAHVNAALKLDPTPESERLAEQIRASMPSMDLADECFEAEEVRQFESLIAQYHDNPAGAAIADQLRALRTALCDILLQALPKTLEGLFHSNFGQVYRAFLKSGFQNEALTDAEARLAEELAGDFDAKGADFRKLPAYMLLRMAHQRLVPFKLEAIPEWFLDDYLGYVLHAPELFVSRGEASLYCAHILEWFRAISRRTRKAPGAALTFRVAKYFLHRANCIPLYFVPESTRELLAERASIFSWVLERSGSALNAKLRTVARRKIKVGFLNAHFTSMTETYSTLPLLHLDRAKFEVCAFALASRGGALEDEVRRLSDELVMLPGSLADQVTAIREAALDILVIGTNVTAVTNQVALLASHRLAPVQLVTNSSPVTTGMRFVDGYVSGTFCERPDAQAHYTEKLHLLDGPAHCFEYTVDAQPAQIAFSREQFGIPENAPVFVSGANCLKIVPELMETWARILSRVEGSRLLLHPFNPNWSDAYPVRQFERALAECFARHGLGRERFVLSSDRLPSRADVKELLRLGDVYLDSYPFAGVNSTVDPLELGIPVVVWEGETFRSLMAGSLLRELDLPELITTDEESYIALAVKLATDATARQSVRAAIEARMALGPRFLDPGTYGRQFGALLETLVPHRKFEPEPEVASGDLLDLAVQLHTAGKFSEAEECYRKLLLANPENPDAWHLLGVLAHQCGDSESGVEFIEQALQFTPDNAVFWNNLAEAYSGRGLVDKALAASRHALELQPEMAEAMVTLGTTLHLSGKTPEALPLFERAIKLKPGYSEAFMQYGIALTASGRLADAASALKKACSTAPGSLEARFHLGVVREEQGRFIDALACYEKASSLNANVGEVWHRWGRLLNGLSDCAKACTVLKEAVRCNPSEPDYHYQYGYALQNTNRFEEALAHFDQAVELGGNTAELHNNRGILLKNKGDGVLSAESFHRALKVQPDNISALNNLGAVCADLGLTTEALECIELLKVRRPDLPSLHNNLGKLLKDSGRVAEAIPAFRRAVELNPDIPDVHHNYLLCINYAENLEPRQIFEAHRAWGERTARKTPPRFKFKPRAAGKLRIGYVSADFCHHPVAVFIEGLFAKQNREKFELFAYSDAKRPDEVTVRLSRMVDHWTNSAEMDHETLAKRIWEDGIDILVDLAGHTAFNRLEMFALKPAPIQVSYLGYPATTGLAAMDYRITDGFADPEGATEPLHVERLLRLPECAWCYQIPREAPPIGLRPSAASGRITFGCFNQLAKLNPPLFDLWIDLLRRVPGSRLKLKARTLQDPGVKQNIAAYFERAGIDASRLDLAGYTLSLSGHLGAYREIDIALDSYPYHGTTTTCEALWMGVPVVTLAGPSHVSRVGVSLLNAVGLPDLVASNAREYVEIAAGLAENTARISELRSGLRTRMLASPLMDQSRFAAAMDDLFERISK